MADSNTSVTVDGLTLAQGDFQDALDKVNTAYSDMSTEQGTLMSYWSGEAASSFGTALNQWLDDLNTVQGQLSIILEKLSSQTGIYANTHEQSTEMANAFKRGLPGLAGI